MVNSAKALSQSPNHLDIVCFGEIHEPVLTKPFCRQGDPYGRGLYKFS